MPESASTQRPTLSAGSSGKGTMMLAFGSVVAMVLLTACGTTGDTTASKPTISPSPSLRAAQGPRIQLPVKPGTDVEGLVEVHGHALYARCAGRGSPTVVYFHGWAEDPEYRPVDVLKSKVEPLLRGQFRVCSYERRNVGRSGQVSGSQTVEDTLGDADGVLNALGEKGPFLLLGASYGGLLTHIFSEEHPDEVKGAVLIDAMLPADATMDHKAGDLGLCNKNNRKSDATTTIEKTDNCLLASYGVEHATQLPKVPMLYLAAGTGHGDTIDASYQSFLRHHWRPLTWRKTGAPHWMEHDAPMVVAKAIREVNHQ